MPTINWNENSPAGADSVGLGANELRSLKTAIRTAVDAEHVFPAAGGDAGVHRLGSARPFYGVQSQVSSTGTDSRLMLTSDTSRLFAVGSGGTVFLGGAQVLSVGSYPGTAPQRSVWALEFGIGIILSGSATTIISYPNSGYSGAPFVFLTPFQGVSSYLTVPFISAIAAANFTARSQDNLASANEQFTWMSIGTRAL